MYTASSDPSFCTHYLFYLLLWRKVLISSTVLHACDYDREVAVNYETHNALYAVILS